MTAINVMKVLDHMVNFRTIHKKTIRNCDQCDDTFKDKNTMNNHKHSKHEVVKYDCGQCDDCPNLHGMVYHMKK